MKKNDEVITMSHGNGGLYMLRLIEDLFLRCFPGDGIDRQGDSAILQPGSRDIAFTTDSFVVDPLFFPGGDIGSVAVCGTLNDLAVSGARPLFLSTGFILEEGFPMADLRRIVQSMAREAEKAGVRIVTGDTKVVNAGKCDKIFINTTGIGSIEERYRTTGTGKLVQPGDRIILNGPPGEHGMAILQERGIFAFRTKLKSDCACLYPMIRDVLKIADGVHFMRDATRGGVATVLNEIASKCNTGVEIDEMALPVNHEVSAVCELLGLDPLYVANEGKVIIVAEAAEAKAVVRAMKKTGTGRNAAIIGEITREHPGQAFLKSRSSGKRILDVLMGDQLPRIC